MSLGRIKLNLLHQSQPSEAPVSELQRVWRSLSPMSAPLFALSCCSVTVSGN